MLSLISVTESVTNFKCYEKKIKEMTRNFGRNKIKEDLETLDEELSNQRNKKIFRNKGKKRIDLKTTLSEVEIYRRVYIINEEELEKINNKEDIMYKLAKKRLEAGHKTIYLLDEMLDLKKYGKITEEVVELMLKYIQDNSYRRTAEIVNDITGLSITGACVWQIIQKIGQELKEKEKIEEEKSKEDLMENGNKESHVIFREDDGVYITLQGKDRKKAIEKYKNENNVEEVPKSVRKKEVKVITLYTCWEKLKNKRKKAIYKIVDKKIFAQATEGVEIKNVVKRYINNTFNIEKLKFVIRNSDGGTWTKGKNSKKEIYQLDWFHVRQTLNKNIKDKEDSKKVAQLLRKQEFAKAVAFCDELKWKYDGEESEVKKLEEVQEYIKENKEGLIRYQDRENFKKIKQKNFRYRNMGIQESTNYSVITSRMKRRRMSFSIEGADNLVRVLAMLKSYDYENINKALEVKVLDKKPVDEAEEYIKEIEENIRKNSKKNKKITDIKYNDSFLGHIPGLEYSKNRELIEIKKLICS